MTRQEALDVLEVGPDTDADALRRAYARKTRAHPPDRDPDGFQRVREAYELLSTAEPAPPPSTPETSWTDADFPPPDPPPQRPPWPAQGPNPPRPTGRAPDDLSTASYAALKEMLDRDDRNASPTAAVALLERGAVDVVAAALLRWADQRDMYEAAPTASARTLGFVALRLYANGRRDVARQVAERHRRLLMTAPGDDHNYDSLRLAYRLFDTDLDVEIVSALVDGVMTGGTVETIRRLRVFAVAKPAEALAIRHRIRGAPEFQVDARFGPALEPYWIVRILHGVLIDPPLWPPQTMERLNNAWLIALGGLLAASFGGGMGTNAAAAMLGLPFLTGAALAVAYAFARLRRDRAVHAAGGPAIGFQGPAWMALGLALAAAGAAVFALVHTMAAEADAAAMLKDPARARHFVQANVPAPIWAACPLQAVVQEAAGTSTTSVSAQSVVDACAVAAWAGMPDRCGTFVDAWRAANPGHVCPQAPVGNFDVHAWDDTTESLIRQADDVLNAALDAWCRPMPCAGSDCAPAVAAP